jgi:hypothetical protein
MDNIPPNFKSLLLPADTLSVGEVINFPMPNVLPTVTGIPPRSFFSTEPPNTDPAEICNVPTPPKRFIDQLQEQLCELKRGSIPIQSILCPHARNGEGKQFDLFILSYWMEIAKLRVIKQKWATAVDQLQGRSNHLRVPLESRQLAEKALSRLLTLPSSGDIHGFNTSSPFTPSPTFSTTNG